MSKDPSLFSSCCELKQRGLPCPICDVSDQSEIPRAPNPFIYIEPEDPQITELRQDLNVALAQRDAVTAERDELAADTRVDRARADQLKRDLFEARQSVLKEGLRANRFEAALREIKKECACLEIVHKGMYLGTVLRVDSIADAALGEDDDAGS